MSICYNGLMESLWHDGDFSDPAELALTKADIVVGEPGLVNTAEERRALAELSIASEELGFNGGRYFVEANRFLCLSSTESDQGRKIRVDDFEERLIFSGVLADYTIIKLGKLELFDGFVRSLCLAFYPFSSLFEFEAVNGRDARALYTPAYAVEGMTRID